jgi:hypothetical protein
VLPPIVFVLGKGGVGRSTVAAALGAGCAARGERVLVLQWAVTDALSPWFGLSPTGFHQQQLAPNLATRNFSLDAAFEQYFVEHLHARAFYRTVIENRHVQRAIAAAPGLAELMFLGNAMAETSIEHSCDRVIVDAPAMGHGESLLAMPRVTRSLALGGLLAVECERVGAMLGDPARSAAIVVTTGEELAVEETLEFWPRIARDLGRPPIAVVLDASVARLGDLPTDPAACPWFAALAGPRTLAIAYTQLARRAQRERVLADRLAPIRMHAIDDLALVADDPTPRDVVAHATAALEPLWSAR